MFPDLSRSLQYLQSCVLQKENPLSLVEVPRCFLRTGGGTVCVQGVASGLRNLSKVVCLRSGFWTGVGVGVGIARGMWRGLFFSSPSLNETCAFTRISLRFLGLLYPVSNFR